MKRLWIILLIVFITGCGAVENNVNNEEEEERDSVVFREIDITVEDDVIHIDGEFKSWDGMFYYHILEGEDIIVQEEEFDKQEHKNIWTPFIIELDEAELEIAEEPPHIVLYGKNKAEETINPNYVPIDLDAEN